MSDCEKAAFLPNSGSGVGTTWSDTAPEEGMSDGEWTFVARGTLRLTVG